MFTLLFLLLFARRSAPNQTALHVIVQNVQVGKGTINVAIFNDKNDFLKKPVAAQIRKADSVTVEFSFPIAPGEYAIAAYQDLNENQQLDAGLFHIPKEPYGFSNNYRPKMSAPKFEDCLIKVAGGDTSTINLK
ncbi:DUF2141 domain-containing protein [Puia dinghuensis]|uniref:DUF2141 domain-containing protein n=1 Tax=Puia dinghuensis TaxID=1792502 RepID=A0A8J2XTB9_9BACT|nr:DUF2141 domain-containing protein [Puia dinghuensis]GGA97886.1 hypothetical protein GCM10011511_21520 [Puia dinghuensis]